MGPVPCLHCPLEKLKQAPKLGFAFWTLRAPWDQLRPPAAPAVRFFVRLNFIYWYNLSEYRSRSIPVLYVNPARAYCAVRMRCGSRRATETKGFSENGNSVGSTWFDIQGLDECRTESRHAVCPVGFGSGSGAGGFCAISLGDHGTTWLFSNAKTWTERQVLHVPWWPRVCQATGKLGILRVQCWGGRRGEVPDQFRDELCLETNINSSRSSLDWMLQFLSRESDSESSVSFKNRSRCAVSGCVLSKRRQTGKTNEL